jgi:glycosyltransferase involved in cell wall biosynthesis
MHISVLIPAYNCAGTIRATLETVLRQTVRPLEIIVLNDGSTDETAAILREYQPTVTVIPGKHEGAAVARNALCGQARGELLAFVDSDDLWHAKYLETRCKAYEANPGAVAFFTAHVNFVGRDANYEWETDPTSEQMGAEVIPGRDFLRRYNQSTGPFGSMSYCAVAKTAVETIGAEPFKTSGGTEDSYLMYELALLGPVVYEAMPLVAYRIIEKSLSANRLKSFGSWVKAFELMEGKYKASGDAGLQREFAVAFASKRRAYAKILMGAGKVEEARGQLRESMRTCGEGASVAKSAALLAATYLPKGLQPSWPPSVRVWSGEEEASAARPGNA